MPAAVRSTSKRDSLRLGNFSRDEVLALLNQHTEETGQAFTADVQELIWMQTPRATVAGQRAGLHSLLREQNRARSFLSVDDEAIREGPRQLILRRETHLDQLTDKLQEEAREARG